MQRRRNYYADVSIDTSAAAEEEAEREARAKTTGFCVLADGAGSDSGCIEGRISMLLSPQRGEKRDPEPASECLQEEEGQQAPETPLTRAVRHLEEIRAEFSLVQRRRAGALGEAAHFWQECRGQDDAL